MFLFWVLYQKRKPKNKKAATTNISLQKKKNIIVKHSKCSIYHTIYICKINLNAAAREATKKKERGKNFNIPLIRYFSFPLTSLAR
jgi:hypothetical protein